MGREFRSLLTAAGCIAVAMLSAASTCHAGILLPEQVTFSERDLERDLNHGASVATRSTTASTSASSSAPIRRIQRDWWSENDRNENRPFELANSNSPTGSSSSSTSTSSVGGASGSGAVVCQLSGTLNLRDDSPLGTLAEDHGLFLPDPPGTDLLRPPRG